ncbi:MAG: hypothetical protein ACI9EV_003028 [Urechidicola sp.]|jgi:hypothetical protein
MNDIICPHCKKTFKVDEAGFADILKQVRDHQFEEELKNRLIIAEREKESAVKLAEAKITSALKEEIGRKDNELVVLQAKSDTELAEKLAKKDSDLAELNSKIKNAEMEQIRVNAE